MNYTVYNLYGRRKYLSREEVTYFIKACMEMDESVSMLCMFLAHTGCRISEALEITQDSFDQSQQCVVIRCLKKRNNHIYRSIPLSDAFFQEIWAYSKRKKSFGNRLWPYSRMTAYRYVVSVMRKANIIGTHASPKGLRHAFGVNAIQSGVPINMVQRWLGHADIKTTAIYANAVGKEERRIAARMWSEV